MKDGAIHVYADMRGAAVLAGHLWTRSQGQRQSASFEYETAYRQRPDAFALDPVQLPLGPGAFHTPVTHAMFNGLQDGAPDRWGRTLMRRQQTRHLGQGAYNLREVDFLLLVDDEARMGALRYRSEETGPFLTTDEKRRIPPLVSLSALLQASTKYLQDAETDDEFRLLLAPGSSLGGARPKASVRDKDGSLLIAKFPRPDDDLKVCEWECLALLLAKQAGIQVAAHRLAKVEEMRVLLLSRFDRKDSHRTPYCSALTLLGTQDNQEHSYLEIAEAIRRFGSRIDEDLAERF